MTPASPIRRRGSQPQALLPRRRARDRTRPWRRALWRRAGRSPSPGRSVSVERTEQRRVASARSRWGAVDHRVAPDPTVPAARAARRDRFAPDPATPADRPAPGDRVALGLAMPRVPAVRAARREMEAGAPPALEPVLRRAIKTAELGSGAGQALAMAAAAERLTELALAGEALDLANSTGAPPGPVLAGVAAAAADRIRTRQARLAATAQARLSARVVAAMAPAFLGVLSLTAPSEAAFLVREPLGWATLAAALTFELLGVAWSAHIVRGPSP
jgi:hypothetical protein